MSNDWADSIDETKVGLEICSIEHDAPTSMDVSMGTPYRRRNVTKKPTKDELCAVPLVSRNEASW